MNHTKILLDETTSKAEKIQSANNIINKHDLPLKIEQILLAHKKIRNFIIGNSQRLRENLKINRILLLNKILDVNTSMYIAIIIALCDNYCPGDLYCLMIITFEPIKYIDVGLDSDFDPSYYCKLLNYYDFDVSYIQYISKEHKSKIEKYRQIKYSGKLTKSAIKNNK